MRIEPAMEVSEPAMSYAHSPWRQGLVQSLPARAYGTAAENKRAEESKKCMPIAQVRYKKRMLKGSKTKVDESEKGRCPGSWKLNEDEEKGDEGSPDGPFRRHICRFFTLCDSGPRCSDLSVFFCARFSLASPTTVNGECARKTVGTSMIVRRW